MTTGTISINNATLSYEFAGEGTPLVLLHAAAADSRQWDYEMRHYSQHYRVIRYDRRGFGLSAPVPGQFRHLDDLVALLDHLNVQEPAIVLGNSMGGALAINLALAHPERVRALILVGSVIDGFASYGSMPSQFPGIGSALGSGDVERATALAAEVWFDGQGRNPRDLNPATRAKMVSMLHDVFTNEVQDIGEALPDIAPPAYDRLDEIVVPTLVIVGERDASFVQAIGHHLDYNLSDVRKVTMVNTAHLPNMEHPSLFAELVFQFLHTL